MTLRGLRLLRAAALLAMLAAAAVSAPAPAAPQAELWARWTAHDEQSQATVDHGVWDAFLKAHIIGRDGINLVGYAGVPDAGRKALQGYIDTLAEVAVSLLRREEQLAYWINLYNALTVDLILDNLPVESIRDISGGLFSAGPWSRETVSVEGEALTLNDIEHRILRPIWKDPRLHYAVNCASLGCPNLASSAYTADNTEALLEQGAREYVNHPRGARLVSGSLEVSSIYSWFAEDFGSTDAAIIKHLRRYAEPDLRRRLEDVDSIGDDDYDWSLNSF